MGTNLPPSQKHGMQKLAKVSIPYIDRAVKSPPSGGGQCNGSRKIFPTGRNLPLMYIFIVSTILYNLLKLFNNFLGAK